VVQIMRDTPEIPADCQWAVFLRNHDELTLEMVTEEERAYTYHAYSPYPQMRINVGIRRRLAPLLDNNKDKIKLLNGILFSLPGTPIVYYGDEIGMGENIYLEDRNGVRTPMQWSADRNAGFSRAALEKLYSAPIMNPVFGYQAVNVEAQELDPSSLLYWMRSIIGIRKQHKVFSRGQIEFLEPENKRVLAYLRSYEGKTVLCVFNLAKTAQSVDLDLSNFKGRKPVELFGESRFNEISEWPYVLTLSPHSFFWLQLVK
ncbi:MAG: alpha-glucosidase C-terminal domain-containing protein, partial [Candidatus Obscuribacterales bacterium]|nr:alpha-glucosidase C-terminal domain-containing protein [Candidatus Obscuribacterales bacterium]